MELVKRVKMCLFLAFTLICSLRFRGFCVRLQNYFGPIVAAACMLDGETTLLNTELGQPLPLHSEI